MGYMRHHAIIVTSWSAEHIDKARAEALEIFGPMQVSAVLKSPVNSYKTFLVAPDGSKEGWPDSDKGDRERTAFVDWMEKSPEGQKLYLDWAELQYGDDCKVTKIVDASDLRNGGSTEDDDCGEEYPE